MLLSHCSSGSSLLASLLALSPPMQAFTIGYVFIGLSVVSSCMGIIIGELQESPLKRTELGKVAVKPNCCQSPQRAARRHEFECLYGRVAEMSSHLAE